MQCMHCVVDIKTDSNESHRVVYVTHRKLQTKITDCEKAEEMNLNSFMLHHIYLLAGHIIAYRISLGSLSECLNEKSWRKSIFMR